MPPLRPAQHDGWTTPLVSPRLPRKIGPQRRDSQEVVRASTTGPCDATPRCHLRPKIFPPVQITLSLDTSACPFSLLPPCPALHQGPPFTVFFRNLISRLEPRTCMSPAPHPLVHCCTWSGRKAGSGSLVARPVWQACCRCCRPGPPADRRVGGVLRRHQRGGGAPVVVAAPAGGFEFTAHWTGHPPRLAISPRCGVGGRARPAQRLNR